ncbi:lysoplasmalogenase [Leptospira idonii]|uniref:Lysoplasmalogenase n=1 Tax=Leptospira idonii TaxID=1193500 RepID=A0A4V3JY25_9LEPT|nr:lysoplasmalogenase [Leptospira idonii]TGN19646.1 lysoplasmalogenase [Leptospira idonii]
MAKEIVLFGLYSIVHLLAILTITKESYFFLPSKIIPILILIVSLVRFWGELQKRGKLVVLALIFSAFGDSFLALPGEKFFVPGLGSFLLAQLIYAYAFSIGSTLKLKLSLPFLAFGGVFFALLVPKLGVLLIPVAVYIAAICLMGWRAAARVSQAHAYRCGLIGAITFMASDSIIAYSMFLNPHMDRLLASMLIMITYYLAQALLYESVKVEELILKEDPKST